MRFTWKESDAGLRVQGTCADASQRVRLTYGVDNQWRGVLDCGVTQSSHDLLPCRDLAQAKRQAQHVADMQRGVGLPSTDRIVYLVVTEPGGEDGRDVSAKGGEVVLATFDKAEAVTKIGRDSRYRLETKVVDVADARTKLLRKLSALDRLVLATAPSAVRQSDFGNDLSEGNRG